VNAIQIVLNISALIAALGAAAAAFFTYMQARSASSSMQTQIFPAFSDRYNDPSMSDAIIRLLKWYHDHPTDFADVWYEKYNKEEPEGLELEKARLKVNRFFTDIGRLYESGQINKQFAYILLGHFGLDVY